MFRKIVSNLPFSPTLINELGFYAKRLKKEEATRKLGLFLTVIALIIQSFTVFSPPESANAANASDIIYGGVHTKSALLSAWDNNRQGFRDLMKHMNVNRSQLANSTVGYIHTRDNGRDAGWMSWGRVSYGSNKKFAEQSFKIGSQTVYVRKLAGWDTGRNTTGTGSWYKSFLMKNSDGQTVAVMQNCGNIAMKGLPIKRIRVCDIKKRKLVTIRADRFNSSKYSKKLSDCKLKPVAKCKDLDVKKVSRTKIKLIAKASTKDGATVSSYTFTIKDSSGNQVFKKTVKTKKSSTTLQHELAKEGDYTAQVAIKTSLGTKTSSACKVKFTIEPIERCHLNPSLPIDHPDCQPCPTDPELWVKDDECSAKVIRDKKATNLTLKADATTVTAKAGNRIEYTVIARNDGKADATFEMKDNLSDSLEYAEIFDYGGGTLDNQKKELSWGQVTIKPGEKQTRSYILKLHDQISKMPRGSSWPGSYDCVMSNTFGETTEVEVECPAPKVIEQVVPELPRTGPTENIIAGGIVATIVTFLYMRSRQLNKEVRLIRRETTAGSI